MKLKTNTAKRLCTDIRIADAVMNIYYVKIYKKKKMYLCKLCFHNINNIPTRKALEDRQIFSSL